MISSPEVHATQGLVADLDRLGDEIAELSAHLDAATAEHVESIVRGWRRVDQIAEARDSARRHKSRALHIYKDEDGMVVIRGRLAPEVGAVVMKALEAARDTLYQRSHNVSAETSLPEVTPTIAQQQADAIALVAETALHRGIDPGHPVDRD